jgi:hypothetical protein
MPPFDDPPQSTTKIPDKSPEAHLDRATRILAAYYIFMPFVLIYLLFRIFPPSRDDWPKEFLSAPIVFFIPKLVIWATMDQRLILLVIVAGALGSYIHSATSYSDYRGNRQFGPSWLLWYLLRPLIGICLALIVYFAMRGGLLSMVMNGDTASDPKNINAFGVAAISGLTGMFSKQAADKLAEVFTTLFKSQGDQNRKDSLAPGPAPEITKVDPPQGSPEGGTTVTITGTGFVSGVKVSFADNPAANTTLVDDTTVTVETPPGEGVVDVIVTNPDGQKATAASAYTYDEDAVDGCDVDLKDDTADEDLPITEGGVE